MGNMNVSSNKGFVRERGRFFKINTVFEMRSLESCNVSERSHDESFVGANPERRQLARPKWSDFLVVDPYRRQYSPPVL